MAHPVTREQAEKNGVISVYGTYDKDFKSFIGFLGRLAQEWQNMPGAVQNRAAHIVANQYKAFLRGGIEPENAFLTKMITGEHPPLESLADHVRVVEAPRKGGKPALVTFEKNWTKIAVMHDRGYAIQTTERMREHLFVKAEIESGIPRKQWPSDYLGTNSGLFIVPARPHIHFLRGEQLQKILGMVAVEFMAGGMRRWKVIVGQQKVAEKGNFKAPREKFVPEAMVRMSQMSPGKVDKMVYKAIRLVGKVVDQELDEYDEDAW